MGKTSTRKNTRSRDPSPKQIQSLEQMVESQINSEASSSITFSTVVKDPNDNSAGTVGHEMDIDTPVSAPHGTIEDPRVDTPVSATHVVVERPNGTSTGSNALEVLINPSTSPPDAVSTRISTGTVDPEMEVYAPSRTSDVASEEVTDLQMADTKTPTSHPAIHTPTPSQEPATAESSVEASKFTTSSLNHPNVPFTLIHVWEDQYTRENTSNLTNTQPFGVPDNMITISTYLFQEFLSLLTPHFAPDVPDVLSTAVAEESSSIASNTPHKASRRFVPRMSPILEESPNVPSKSPALDRLIKEADARRNSMKDAPKNDAVDETETPGSRGTPSVVTDSMTAAASRGFLRERKSQRTALEIMQEVIAESPCKTRMDLKFKKLINEPTGKNIKHISAAPRREDETSGRLSQAVRSNESVFNTPFRDRLGRSAHAQRMQLRSEQTQTYDADGNLVLSGGRGSGLLAGLIDDEGSTDSDDEGILRVTRRNQRTRLARPRKKATESTEAPQSFADIATASKQAINHDLGNTAGETQVSQATPEIGNGHLIATTPALTTPSRRWIIGSLLNSARSVSKFIPGFGHSTPARPLATLPAIDSAANTHTPDSRRLALPAPENKTPPSASHPSRSTQTEPRQRASATASPAHGARTAIAPKTFRTKKDIEKQKPIILMRGARRQKQKEDAEREEELEKAKKDAEEMRKEEEKATVPGEKRKRPRAPSPDVIPNPPGGGYGMHPDYFWVTSSDEDAEDGDDVDISVQKGKQRASDSDEQPRSKRMRVTEDQDDPEPFSHEVIGDPHRARPYTGTVCPLPTSNGSLYHGGNIFEQADSTKKVARPSSPEFDQECPNGPTMTFTVPYSDSEDDGEDKGEDEMDELDSHDVLETPKVPKAVSNLNVDTPTPKSVTNVDADSTTGQRAEDPNAANVAYWAKLFGSPNGTTSGLEPAVTPSPQIPSRSSSSNGTLAPGNNAIDTEALARARSQALKYTPKQPSGLRAQSRLSTSTVASDVGEEVDEALGGPETPAASQNSTQADDGQQGDSNTIGPQDSAMVGIGKQRRPEGTAGMTVGEGQQQLSEGAMDGMDDEVRAAIEAIFENDLIQFNFPTMRSYAEQGIMDPEVEAYLNANWTEADTARAERSFELGLEIWKAEQQFIGNNSLLATP